MKHHGQGAGTDFESYGPRPLDAATQTYRSTVGMRQGISKYRDVR